MASDLLLPLFPLEVVLLPHTTLPLHIFEERYKIMIGEAIQNRSEFGIVLAKAKALLNVGCTAAVTRVVKRYPDGRLDIITTGRRRFEILFLDEQKPYLQAAVHFFDDDPDTAPEPEPVQRLGVAFEKAFEYLPGQADESAAKKGPLDSFRVAGALPVDLDLKQRLLVSRSEADRVGVLNEYLEKLLPRLQLAKDVEKSARGNGRRR